MPKDDKEYIDFSKIICPVFFDAHKAIRDETHSEFWLLGGRGCVHPDTLLSTPNGYIKISDFNGGEIHIHDGEGLSVAYAPKPIKYKPEPLYKITLHNGESIITTNKHRFLTDKGWVTLASLSIGCEIPLAFAFPHQTILDTFPSEYQQDALHCLRKVLGFLYCYWQDYRQCDAQPPHELDTYQDILRKLSDEPQHSSRTLNPSDDSGIEHKDDHQILLLRLSSLIALLAKAGKNYIKQENHICERFFEQLSELYQQSLQSHAKTNPHELIQELSKLIFDCGSDINLFENLQTISDILQLGVGDESYSDSFHCNHSLHYQRGVVVAIEFHSLGEFYDIFVPFYNNYVTKGGIINHNSTKSSFTAIQIILGIIDDPNANALCLRKVGDTVRTSLYTTLLWAIDLLGVHDYFRSTVSPAEIIYIPTGQKIIMKGLDDPLKLKSIKAKRGYFKYLWFEEAGEFNGMDEIRNVEQSVLRGGDKFVEFITYNPPNDPAAWVNKESAVAVAGRIVHESNYTQVPRDWLGERFIEKAEWLKQQDPIKYAHEYMGQAVGRAEQIIFYGKWEEKEFATHPMEQIFENRFFYGCDWGFANDPTAVGRQYIVVENGKRNLYIEYEAGGVGIEFEQLSQLFDSIPDIRTWKIYADSARPETISYMQRQGFRIEGAEKWKGSVEDGIEYMRSFDRIYIHPRCKKTIEEFMKYSYKVDRITQEILPVIVDDWNHYIDLIRYSLGDYIKKQPQGFFDML